MRLRTPSKIQDLQRKLYCKSKTEPRYRFYTLWDKVYRMDVLEEAWRRVKANRGAAGVDGETIAVIEECGAHRLLEHLRDELKAKIYRPLPVQRVWIPKAKGGMRPLGIPAVSDRIVQTAVKIVLEPILEAAFHPSSYGFRPKRNAHQAIREVVKFLNWGLVQVVDADIRDFFGQIPRNPLIRVIAQRVVDGSVLRIVRDWLVAGVMEEGRIKYETTGTPQGGVISPLLANAYLNEIDWKWERAGYTARFGMNAHIVRYADDLVVLTNQNAGVSWEALRRSLNEIGLELHTGKTRIVNAERESFDFLGFNFRKTWNREKTKRFTLFMPSAKAQGSMREKIRETTRYERTDKLEVIIQELNPMIRGWVNYFRIGNSSRTFDEIRHYVMKKVRRYIRRKQKKKGFGWKSLPNEIIYGRYGLYYDYKVLHTAG